ncbi:MAG: GWxTD domain-containing protein [candidate division WOR-3 bacterium]|jgi:GWxTD domain-containing protein
MIPLLLLLVATDGIEFYNDPIIYKTSIKLEDTITHTFTTQDFYYIEFNCEIPYQELHYQSAEDIIFTNVVIPFKIIDQSRPDSLVDTLYRQFTIPSFSQAAKQQISFLVQFGTYLPEGDFRYKLEMLSGEKRGVDEAVLEIRHEDYPMSDILLSSEITVDTTGDYLRKGNLRVVPRPSRIFDQRFKNLCFYYELYDIASAPDTIHAEYTVIDQDDSVVRKVTRTIEKVHLAQAVNCGINIENIASGKYRLVVKIADMDLNILAEKEIPFQIARAERHEVSFEGMPYYHEIELFLSAAQYREFKNLPEEGQKMFLDRFWRTYDYHTIAARFEYVNKHYRFGDTPGHKTDRGRIYVKYGEPDEIERPTPLQHQEQRPYEHWQYLNGEQFIFVDTRGINEYILVWTNALDERSQPTLYKYLPAEKVESLGIIR